MVRYEKLPLWIAVLIFSGAFPAKAALKLPALFSDNMVLQRDQADLVWGWDSPGTTVEVAISGQTKSAVAGKDGRWTVELDAMPAASTPLSMSVKGSSTIEVKNILIGEVWICSGQSNMAFPLSDAANAEVEIPSMKHPDIRLITVPPLGTQVPQRDFTGAWTACTPETAKDFSAIGLFYGRYVQEILGVPVGLICDAWGGSYIEAWLSRPLVEHNPDFADLMEQVIRAEARATTKKYLDRYEQQLADWEKDVAEAEQQHLPKPKHPHNPRDYMDSNQRLGNSYNGMLFPVLGYGIKGVIWYQGEANADDANLYDKLFPLLIGQCRRDWNNPNLPFYWVQLPTHGERDPSLLFDGAWPLLRDAQTKTMQLPHTGQAVTIDVGDGNNLHPKDKLDVAARLARWALAKDYGVTMLFHSPSLYSITPKADGKLTVTFDFVGRGLCTRETDAVTGFALCGADHVWHWAIGDITQYNTVDVWCDAVPKPLAVRYGWTDNPNCNLFSKEGLPATPFRTDDFAVKLPEKPAPTAPAGTPPSTPGSPPAAK